MSKFLLKEDYADLLNNARNLLSPEDLATLADFIIKSVKIRTVIEGSFVVTHINTDPHVLDKWKIRLPDVLPSGVDYNYFAFYRFISFISEQITGTHNPQVKFQWAFTDSSTWADWTDIINAEPASNKAFAYASNFSVLNPLHTIDAGNQEIFLRLVAINTTASEEYRISDLVFEALILNVDDILLTRV